MLDDKSRVVGSSMTQTNDTRNSMPHIWVGDIGRSRPWSSARVVVFAQYQTMRRTHRCARASGTVGGSFVNHRRLFLMESVMTDEDGDESNVNERAIYLLLQRERRQSVRGCA